MTRKRLFGLVCVGVVAACGHTVPQPPPVEVARAYLEAVRDRDLEGMRALCVPGATAFERADEGTVSEYLERHLGPELSELESVAMALGEPTVHEGADDTLAVVAWPIRRFTMGRADGQVVNATGAATFVLGPIDGVWRIRHVHWTLRTDGDHGR